MRAGELEVAAENHPSSDALTAGVDAEPRAADAVGAEAAGAVAAAGAAISAVLVDPCAPGRSVFDSLFSSAFGLGAYMLAPDPLPLLATRSTSL